MKFFAGVSARRLAILAIQPVLALAVGLTLRSERGPYWQMRFLDPDYVYLLSALRVAQLKPPRHNDHPGLTVQVPAGILLRAVEIVDRARGVPHAGLIDGALTDPERRLRILSDAMLVAASVSLFFAGIFAIRAGFSPGSAATIQAAWLLTPIILSKGIRVGPEAVFPILLPWAGLLLLWYGQNPRARWSSRVSVTAGGLLALLIATKLTALPWLALILLPGTLREGGRILAATVASLAVLLLPIYTRLLHVRDWVIGLVTHTGIYGAGDSGVIDLHSAARALTSLASRETVLFVVAFLTVLVLGHHITLERPASGESDALAFRARRTRALLVAALVTCGTIIMTAKHPGQHYLLPASGVLGAVLVLLFAVPSGPSGELSLPKWAIVMTAIFALRTVQQVAQESARNRESREQTNRLVAGVAAIDPACIRVYYYSASSVAYALSFADFIADRPFEKSIGVIRHDDAWIYNVWTRRLTQNGNTLPLDTAFSVPCLVLQGTPKGDPGLIDSVAAITGRVPEYALSLFRDANAQHHDSATRHPLPMLEQLPQSNRTEMAWLVRLR